MSETIGIHRLMIEGREQYIECSGNQTLLQALIHGGIFLEANCGGRGTCGKCKVQVLEGQVAGAGRAEAKPKPGTNDTYLACQVYPQGDVVLRLPQSKVSAKGSITEILPDDGPSILRKIVLTPEYPTVNTHYSMQEMVKRVCPNSNVLKEKGVLRQLAAAVDASPDCLTATLFDDEIIAVEAGNTVNALFGAAFDIGTTTVVGMLVDINERKIVAVCSETNPQAAYGADVISRIQAAVDMPGGLEAQSQVIRQCLNRIINELCNVSGVSPDHIYAATIAGNSTMSHLLLGISPAALVRKPYAPVFKDVAPFCPEDIGLGINKCGKIIILPNIASFIGSDTTAAVLAIDQNLLSTPMILVDLGTNGEMVLSDGNKLYACSTAAGPAFEGSHIRDGMRATAGAISHVTITDDVRIEVIGNVKPAGICGSGMVMAVAELVKAGIIGPTGRFNKASALPPNLGQRLKQAGNQWEFVLAEGKDSATGADISVTQADIRQIQLVKSSICTGIQFLLEQTRSVSQFDVCLAGAFGNYIDIDSALTIGMFPDFSRENIRSVGNAAGAGAVHALLSAEKLRRCSRIANDVEYLELAAQPSFQNKFLGNLSFPGVIR
ncbi:Na(+)-translocating NADH-quinone reductase subunit F [Sporomusa carbonis]|uniref:ASKHA domain-containing protein n=1 Tax=Sporomusa carbonis TaxID=3076075 RepID=UPI003A787E54